MKLGEILLRDKKLSQEQLEEAILIQSKSQKLLGQILVDSRYTDEETVAAAVSEQLQIEYIDALPEGFAASFDFLTKEYCTANNCIVISNGEITMLVVNVFSGNIYKDLSVKTNVSKIYISTQGFILKNLGYIITEQEDPEKYLKNIIDMAASKGASDIHFNPVNSEVVFSHLVVDGELQKLNPVSVVFYERLKNVIKNKGGINNVSPRDTVGLGFNSGNIQIRAELYPVKVKDLENQHKLTLRLLGGSKKLLRLDELGFNSETVELLSKTLLYNSGLILISGPTSSGKSTTIFAILKMIADQMDRYIYTIEDPVEIHLANSNVAQGEINNLVDYEKSIKSILRSAPDVIVIGEVRDKEVAKQAIIAAETGHLVFATVHAYSSLGIIRRLENLGINKHILLDSVRLLMGQRLYSELCSECKEQKNITDYPENYLKDNLLMEAVRKADNINQDFIVYEKGHKQCKICGGTGYIQRKAVMEAIEITDNARLTMLNEASIFNMEKLISYKNLKQRAYSLLTGGTIDIKQYYKIGY